MSYTYVGRIYEKSTYVTLVYRLDQYLVIDEYEQDVMEGSQHPILFCVMSDMRTGETYEVSARQLDRQMMYKRLA